MMGTEKIRNYTDHSFKSDIQKIRSMFFDKEIDAIIAPFRGGLTLGTKLSHVLDLPLGIINYQRLDSNSKTSTIQLAIEPVGKDDIGEEVPFWAMKKILLVDDILDTGYTMEKIYRYLQLINPDIDITIVCLFGSDVGIAHVANNLEIDSNKLVCLRPNNGRWILFETWENDMNICKWCKNGEPCHNDRFNKTHCNLKDKSFNNKDTCENFQVHIYDNLGTAPVNKKIE